MTNYDQFKKTFDDYENKIYELFLRIIYDADKYAIEQNMDPLDRFLYVNSKIEGGYRDLACAQGIISSPDLPYEVTPPISDSLMERIYSYIEPLAKEATAVIEKQFDEVMASSTLGELMEKYEKFKEMIDKKEVMPFLYESVEIKKRV